MAGTPCDADEPGTAECCEKAIGADIGLLLVVMDPEFILSPLHFRGGQFTDVNGTGNFRREGNPSMCQVIFLDLVEDPRPECDKCPALFTGKSIEGNERRVLVILFCLCICRYGWRFCPSIRFSLSRTEKMSER